MDFPLARAEFHRVPRIRASFRLSRGNGTLNLEAWRGQVCQHVLFLNRLIKLIMVAQSAVHTTETPPLQGGNATAHGSDVT
eukprot:3928012-Rhodomonas_salina.2